MRLKYSSSLICCFAALSLTAANKDNTIREGLGYGPGPGEDEAAFREANMSPNATGMVDLRAHNMSAPPNEAQDIFVSKLGIFYVIS